MSSDIQPWKPAQPEFGIKPTERLNSIQKADIIRMSRIEAILQETLAREGMPNAVGGDIWRNEEDATSILWTKEQGFFIQWHGPATYLQVKEEIKSYGEDTVEFFSHFPKSSEYTNPELRLVTNRIKEAIVSEPTTEELQRLPEILAANHRKVSEAFLFQIKQAVAKGEIWSIPHDLQSAKDYAREAGIHIDPQLEQDILHAYHLKRRQLDLAKLPKVRGDVMRKMDPFVNRIIESGDFLGQEHPEVVKSYAGRAALQALRIIRDYVPFGFNKSEEAQGRVKQLKYWEQKALKWADVAGIDISQQLEALRVYVNSETQEILKSTPRKLLDALQRRIKGENSTPKALVSKPDLGPEDKEIEPAYQDDISVLIKTKKGRAIGAQLRNDEANQDFRIIFPLNLFTKEEVVTALAKTFPEAEVYHLTPASDRKAAGVRIPLEEERPVGGSKVRALWLSVREGTMDSFGADTLASPDGPVERFYYPQALNVKIEGEFDTTGTYVLGDGWILHSMYHPQTDAEWSEMHQKLGTILEHLFENGNVIEDSIASISIHPGSGSPMKPEEFTKKEGYHLEKVEQQLTIEDVSHLKTKEEETVDHPNCKAGKYIFQEGRNQFGIINRRSGYLTCDLYTLVKFYPEGLHFYELAQEIEKLRVM